jgi:hypothetical protein
MPNPQGNPEWKPKYGEPTKVVRLPESLAEQVTALLKQEISTIEVLQQLESVPLLHRSQLPEIAAIYLVYQGDRLLYIGRTGNLKQRWIQHHRQKQFAAIEDVRIAWFPCHEGQPELEATLIELLEPQLNGQEGSRLDTKNRVFSFRLNDAEIGILEARKLQGESIDQTARRLLKEVLGVPAGRTVSTAPLTPENIPGLEKFILRVIAQHEGDLVGEAIA